MRRRGLILPVTLLIIALLAILSASFALQARAHRSAVYVTHNRVQLRLAAEAGMQYVLLLLRENRHDRSLWYDNEELFHNQVVWSSLGDRAKRDISEELDTEGQTFRFSLVADDPDDDLTSVRYGITDESSKLNINFATQAQLTTLFSQILPEEAPIAALVDSLIDWRDQDNEPGALGAEAAYYLALDPPYTIKNNVFETVEELLLVKGFSAPVLFGEDVNRNGLLDPGEDDGEESFPIDNRDGVLQRGIHGFLTVWSRDLNRSIDNINRIDLNMGDTQQLAEELGQYFDEDIVDYIVTAKRSNVTFTSPVQLLGHSYTPGGNPGQGSSSGDQDTPPPVPAVTSPVTLEDLPALCDRTTAIRQPGQMGLININTASREVLFCLVNAEFSPAAVEAIIETREIVSPEKLATVAWLLTEGAASQQALESIFPAITARSQQFHIESVGYADHIGMMVRIQAVVELRGHVPQYMYYRDLSELGAAYHLIRGDRAGEGSVRHRRG